MIKHILRFLAGGIIVAFLGWLAIFGLRYWALQNDPETKVLQQMQAMEKQYAEDPYGGETPEETLALFIAALKKGDTELAAKYFVIDEQQNWREQLSKIQEKGLLTTMIIDVQRAKKYRSTDTEAFFTAGNDDGEATVVINLAKVHSKWKLNEL
ncbi:MAG: hypothetical protein HYT37_04265 [Candidatus Sungbacteria bacterium]|nr:hypothetical protein [Candidatus Sungbacteria bacterium]